MRARQSLSSGKRTELFNGLRNYPDFSEYFSGDQRFAPFQEEIRTRKYAIGDTTVKYRNLDHWEEKGLLPDGNDSRGRGWRRFNLVEVVWLEALNRFRDFGISLENIAKIKESVLQWSSNHATYPVFEYFIAKAITQPEDPYVVMCRNGNSGILSSSEIETLKMCEGNRDLLLISIKSILSDLGIQIAHSRMLLALSDEELEIIKNKRISEAENPSYRRDFADFFAQFEDGNEIALEIQKKK